MIRTTNEEVTRVYCDVCNKDITNRTKIGAGFDYEYQDWVVCGGKLSYQQSPNKTVSVSCEDLAKLQYENPSIFSNIQHNKDI
jgi:hypothetical protein